MQNLKSGLRPCDMLESSSIAGSELGSASYFSSKLLDT